MRAPREEAVLAFVVVAMMLVVALFVAATMRDLDAVMR